MTTERFPPQPDLEQPNTARAISKPLLYTLLAVGGALLIAFIVLIAVVVRPQQAASDAPLTPSGTATASNSPSPRAAPLDGATPQAGDDAADAEAENPANPEDENADPAADPPADQPQPGDDDYNPGPSISLLSVTSITVTGAGGASLAQICAPGNNPQAYGANQDKQPAVLKWTTAGAAKTTLKVNGEFVFQQPANGEHLFVFDCFTNTGGVNTWRFDVNAADSDNNVKSAYVVANVNGVSELLHD